MPKQSTPKVYKKTRRAFYAIQDFINELEDYNELTANRIPYHDFNLIHDQLKAEVEVGRINSRYA